MQLTKVGILAQVPVPANRQQAIISTPGDPAHQSIFESRSLNELKVVVYTVSL